MVVSDSVFDVALYGLLAVALVIDFIFPSQLHGVATVLAVGAATYGAAQDLSFSLTRRDLWSQESLSTALSLCTLGFIYYYWRNDADIILVVLSLGLMMASLMALIALVGCLGACIHNASAKPLAGAIITLVGAVLLGIGAGLLILFLTSPSVHIALKIALLVFGLVVFKMRQVFLGGASTTLPSVGDTALAPPTATPEAPAAPRQHGWLLPQRGTVLDRVVPVLVLGALAFALLPDARPNLRPDVPAAASSPATSASNEADVNPAASSAAQ